jgi:hypothetical protein
MSLFMKYLKSHRRIFLVSAVFCGIFAASFLLYHLPLEAVLYPMLLCIGIGIIICAFDFSRTKRMHSTLHQIKTITDAATAAFPPTRDIADEDYRQIIRLLTEDHNAYRTETARRYADMIEYYTVWAHQIKTPIASMRLHLQNEDSPLSRKLSSDLHRVEQYVEMVLTFLRLDSESTDYVIREYNLDDIVKRVIKTFSSDFIDRKLSLIYEPLNTTVISDEKWLSFVIEQVLSNALKYTPSGSISITLEGEKTLRIRDTGIGIAPEDLPRIFEKGYTGYNGRTDRKSSGIGLYLCQRICSNLGHKITATSVVDVGTTIDIDLYQRKLEIE